MKQTNKQVIIYIYGLLLLRHYINIIITTQLLIFFYFLNERNQQIRFINVKMYYTRVCTFMKKKGIINKNIKTFNSMVIFYF